MTPLGDNAIHIWRVHVPAVLERLSELEAVLSEAERNKAARYHRDSDRQTSIAARGTLRILISGYTGISASEIRFEYSENGKPCLVPQASCLPCSFNVSHSGAWVVLAFGRNRQVGVDVEKIRCDMNVMDIASRYFTPEESALIERAANQPATFFHFWARKEAYVKATGSGLFRELSSFAVPSADTEKDGWHFRRLEVDPNYAAAVVSDGPIAELRCFDFCG